MIASITLVRNEADIIESFIRYNLQYLNVMFVVDKESSDRTVEIIRNLQKEGYPIYLDYDYNSAVNSMKNSPEFNECTHVIPLNADEFLSVESDANLQQTFKLLKPGKGYYIKRRTYLPHPEDHKEIALIPERIIHCRDERFDSAYKIFIPRGIIFHPDVQRSIASNDTTCVPSSNVEQEYLLNDLRLAYFPLRSVEQIKIKKIGEWITAVVDHAGNQGFNEDISDELLQKIRSGGKILESDFYQYAKTYDLKSTSGNVELIKKPIIQDKNKVAIAYSESTGSETVDYLIKDIANLALKYENIASIRPKTSIIMLTHNQLEYTKLCVSSIREFTEPGSYELIIVDNQSTDGTKEWLKEQKDIRVIYNDYNAGFPAGCNQGIRIAKGEQILLLNNDTIVTSNWLINLSNALNSSPTIGAVGPVTNSASYYQAIPTSYQTINEMFQYAETFNRPDMAKWEYRLKLIGFCMLIKREVIEKVGLLDERFTPGNFEDDDYSYRIIKEGYNLLLCKDTFIHHFGGTSFSQYAEEYTPLMKTNSEKFEMKWGFNPGYSSNIRFDILGLIDSHRSETLRVLEVGCACGGTLLEIKNRFPNSELHGIELNPSSAHIASTFANVIAEDIEKGLSYPKGYFDYIIFGDVLEHLYNPWLVVQNMKDYLKPTGKLLVSLPNIMHFTIFKSMLEGNWTYTDAGLLDRTHVRFFTKKEMIKMFENAGFPHIEINPIMWQPSQSDQLLIKQLSHLAANPHFEEEALAYQYLFRAHNNNKYKEINSLIDDLIKDPSAEYKVNELAQCICSEEALFKYTINKIAQVDGSNALYNQLAILLFNMKQYDFVIPMLQAALSISQDDDTLYNLGYVLIQAGEYDLARSYLEKIQVKDKEILDLISLTVE